MGDEVTATPRSYPRPFQNVHLSSPFSTYLHCIVFRGKCFHTEVTAVGGQEHFGNIWIIGLGSTKVNKSQSYILPSIDFAIQKCKSWWALTKSGRPNLSLQLFLLSCWKIIFLKCAFFFLSQYIYSNKTKCSRKRCISNKSG